MNNPAERALAIAAEARRARDGHLDREQQDRLDAARRTQAEAPELYAFAQALRRRFGPGTRVRWVQYPDGSEWGSPASAEGALVPTSDTTLMGGSDAPA